jgi:hypothetical protein
MEVERKSSARGQIGMIDPKRTLNGQDDGSKSRDGCGLQPLLGEPGRDRLGQWPDVVGKGVSLDARRAGVG